MQAEEIEHKLKTLVPKLEDGTITKDEEVEFLTLYQKYAKIVEDEANIETIKSQL